MKKVSLACLLLCSTSAMAEKGTSFSELRVGFERISYSEVLADVANLGVLSQSISVTNPTVRQLSYSKLDDEWGFYIDSAATLSADIDTETWSMNSFGDIQQNAFKIKANEIGARVAYNYSPLLQLTMGGKFSTSSFTRSNFKFVQPGAKSFDDALIALPRTPEDSVPRFLLPSQTTNDAITPQQELDGRVLPVVSVTEDQMSMIFNAGVRYDTQFNKQAQDFTWYAEADVGVPVYNEIQNTQFETTTLSENFNGIDLTARAGLRYHLTEKVAIVAGVDALYKKRDVVSKVLENGKRLRVPEVEYDNIAVTAGIYWNY
ncbi:autotransporter outer membrane beta-barrel domain-containing protein [Psychrobium sp. 1_MG-2023]|uniref:autotransporter outer membrane beta-barrel domain-containing protein n=1 Tax=Psychrobium sp. 1_MG-2023 TaxID=3062624 RepID=UPI002680C350|nr:autotransporter outer membrane beta-barrel domain-containing protein [Psychrobium sp. 1_MG-2023]MDP2561152.1 autotransporter outer membrane beta-barrel domain-containing protein [Psychrobium sp. 1_MG-2023]